MHRGEERLKKPTILSNPSQVPATFDLKKYDAAASLSGAGWYTNLMTRALRRTMYEHDFQPHIDEVLATSESIFRSPIGAEMQIRDGDGFTKNVFRKQVRDMSAFEYLSCGDTLGWRTGDAAARYKAAYESATRDIVGEDELGQWRIDFDSLEVPAWKMLDDCGIDNAGSLNVSVDLHASDDKLLDDFKAWLRSARAATGVRGPSGRLQRSDFMKLHEFRVLPYLDLTLWAECRGLKFTQQLLGATLFPDEYHVALSDRIRKVVAPMSAAACSPPHLEALFAQLLEESELKQPPTDSGAA